MGSADAERPDLDAFDPVSVERVFDRGRLGRFAEPPRPQEAQVHILQPPEREPECARRRGVEPLEVVDRKYELVLGEQFDGAAHRHAERTLVDGSSGRVLDEQRDLERASPRRRQLRQDIGEDVFEQVAEAGIRERPLRFRRPRREHAEAALTRVLDGRAPERRLPDPRLAFERDRGRALDGCAPVEKRRQGAELLVPPDDLDCHLTTHRDTVARESQAPRGSGSNR